MPHKGADIAAGEGDRGGDHERMSNEQCRDERIVSKCKQSADRRERHERVPDRFVRADTRRRRATGPSTGAER